MAQKMISSFLFVPIDTNLNLLKKKNHFSTSFYFMFLIPWIGIIDVVSNTDVLIIFLHCEPANTSMRHHGGNYKLKFRIHDITRIIIFRNKN